MSQRSNKESLRYLSANERKRSYGRFYYQDKVRWIGGLMIDRLQANHHRNHWGFVTNKWLLYRLGCKVTKLKKAIESGNSARMIREATHVANFAMMIADKANNHGGVR